MDGNVMGESEDSSPSSLVHMKDPQIVAILSCHRLLGLLSELLPQTSLHEHLPLVSCAKSQSSVSNQISQ
jgi:hypothetical protein